MVTNKDTAEIVAGVMNIAQQLGLHVVAEGIEHEDQRGRLRALKCNAGQGDLSTPVDVGTAAALLKTGLAPRPDRTQPTRSVWKDASVSQYLIRAKLLVTRQRVSFAAAGLVLLLSAGRRRRRQSRGRPAAARLRR